MFGARVPEFQSGMSNHCPTWWACWYAKTAIIAQSILWLSLFLKLGVTFTQNCGTISPFCAYCDVWCHSSRVACPIIVQLGECVGMVPRQQWLPNPVCYLACFWLIGNVVVGVLLVLPLPVLLFHSCSLRYSSRNCTAGHHCWWLTACLSQEGMFVLLLLLLLHCQVNHPQHAALYHANKIVLDAGGGVQLFKE